MGHYSHVQRRGTKETNNGLMKGDGLSPQVGETPKGQRTARKYAFEEVGSKKVVGKYI